MQATTLTDRPTATPWMRSAPKPDVVSDTGGLASDTTEQLLAGALDALDQAMIVLGTDGLVRIANRAARREFETARRLQLCDQRLRAGPPADDEALRAAVRAAEAGRRTLLKLRLSSPLLTLAVLPMGPLSAQTGRQHVLVMGSRERASGRLAVQMYARTHEATAAETDVLQALCDGLSPQDIAAHFGVSLCTVRTQIHGLRSKTGSSTVNQLLRKLAQLPPVVPVLD